MGAGIAHVNASLKFHFDLPPVTHGKSILGSIPHFTRKKNTIMGDSIIDLVDQLPKNNITVKVLNALDFMAPGQWHNTVGFDETIRAVTGEHDPRLIQRIKEKSLALYQDNNNGYQAAIRLYQVVDKADTAMATAALANKIGEKIQFLSFVNKITPKADTAQTIDLILKVVVEIIAFCKIHGLSQPSPQAFVESLKNNYTDASLLRMVTLVCVDGLLPLGPDFLAKIHSVIDGGDASLVQGNPVFSSIGNSLPGDNPTAKFGFITDSFNAVQGWMNDLITKTGITPQTIFQKVGSFISVADDSLDFVAAFLDQTTNYYEHTGIQSVARALILAAYGAVKQEPEVLSGGSDAATGVYQVGQQVEALSDEYWYAATIREVQGTTVSVRYLYANDPSEDEWLPQKNIRLPHGNYGVGDEVEVFYSDGEWYGAEIVEIDGDTYLVEYTDEEFYEDEDSEVEQEWVAWQRICAPLEDEG